MKKPSLLSTRALARRIDVDPRTLLRLVAKGIVAADYRAGQKLLFFEDRMKQLRAAVRSRRSARL